MEQGTNFSKTSSFTKCHTFMARGIPQFEWRYIQMRKALDVRINHVHIRQLTN